SLAAQTSSVWTCVAITVDRFLAIKYPLRTRIWCSPARAKLVLSVIATVSFLYKLPSLFELTLDECGRLTPTQLRTNPLYIVLYNTYGYLLLLIIIPWTVMIVLNVIVIRAVNRAYHIRRSLMQVNVAKVDDKERRCTLMAIAMILTFILCNLMAGINQIIEAFFEDYVSFFRLRLPIGNLLVCVNSASNIIIYSLFGRNFRRMCVTLLCPCVTRKDYKWLQPTIVQACNGTLRRDASIAMPEVTDMSAKSSSRTANARKRLKIRTPPHHSFACRQLSLPIPLRPRNRNH
uniref:G-protein coupled receptors family 1 profile domain-containing protein n=1 Tax=Parascaris univalens TaxID=6257 RepID=A0A915CGL2_PARUN